MTRTVESGGACQCQAQGGSPSLVFALGTQRFPERLLATVAPRASSDTFDVRFRVSHGIKGSVFPVNGHGDRVHVLTIEFHPTSSALTRARDGARVEGLVGDAPAEEVPVVRALIRDVYLTPSQAPARRQRAALFSP